LVIDRAEVEDQPLVVGELRRFERPPIPARLEVPRLLDAAGRGLRRERDADRLLELDRVERRLSVGVDRKIPRAVERQEILAHELRPWVPVNRAAVIAPLPLLPLAHLPLRRVIVWDARACRQLRGPLRKKPRPSGLGPIPPAPSQPSFEI
jgi:hypothetical protein